jgi:hypothetical protein
MKLINKKWFRAARWTGICLVVLLWTSLTLAQTFTTTTVQGTVYLANGTPGAGTLLLSWPAFTTAANQTVMAGRTTVTIGADGFVSVNLAPNQGATPAGLFYTAVFSMSDGSTSTEYWVVPAAAQATLAQVRAQVMPAVQALQAVNKAYVDQAIQLATQSVLTGSGGTLAGPLYLSGDPTQPLQAADKRYVDTTFSQAATQSGAASLTATSPQIFSGAISTPSITASVNAQINVQAPPYSAKGDCTTDDSAAIQAAVNAAGSYSPPAVVYFPKPSGGCYLTSTIQWNGAPLKGQPPPHGLNSGGGGVVIEGKPGQDIFHVVDPTTVGSSAPSRLWSIESLDLMVDNTSAGNFPHRWPGRWVSSGAMTAGSTTLTASGAAFSCGDIGQPVRVIGAGASGADLITTISAVPSCYPVSGANSSATLAAAASTTVSNALTYISVDNIPVTVNIGNAAIAFDQYDGKSADWHMTGSVGALGDAIRDVDFTAKNGNACQYLDQCPTAAAIYFQGSWAPYGIDARNINFGPGLMFGLVEGTPDTNPQSGGVGSDYQTWDIGGWHVVYPWISYNGTFNKISRVQLADQFGPQILSVSSGTEYQPNMWTIDSNPEFEQNCYYQSTAPSTCVPGIGWRIEGGQHYVNMTKLASNSATAYLDTFVSKYTNDSIFGKLQLNGYDNKVQLNSDLGGFTLTGWTDGGIGNVLSGEYLASPYHSQAQTRTAAININRGNALVGQITPDFIRSGNVSSPYFNDTDLMFWPDDLQWLTGPPATKTDTNSLTGKYTAITANNSVASFSLFNVQNGNPNNSLGRAMICTSSAGCEIPATNNTIYVSAKCPTDTSYNLQVRATNTTVTNATIPCSTTYTTTAVTANFSTYSGSYLQLYFGVTTEVDLAWVAVRPFQANYNGHQPAFTDTANTFSGIQTLSGLSVTGATSTAGINDSGGIAESGNIHTSGFTQQIYEGDANTNRLDSPNSTSGNGRLFSSGTETIQGNTSAQLDGAGTYFTVNSSGASLTAGKTYQINGSPLSASNLSNGTIGSGRVVLANSTLGCLDGYDHLPCVVAQVSLSGQTNAIAPAGTQFFTVPASGEYQIKETATVSAVGTSGSLQTNVRTYNAIGATSVDCQTGSIPFTASGETWGSCPIYAASGATMSYWEANAPNGATWNLYVTVERLQ